MAKTKSQKQTILTTINQEIQAANSVIFSVFDKLPVNEDQKLRQELRKNAVKYQVVKKTLLKKSFTENKLNAFPDHELVGNIAMASSLDEVNGAKVLAKFAKEKEGFKIVGGILNRVWVDTNKIIELAKLPPKNELIAKTVGTIKAPLTGFVNVVSGNLRGLVNVLKAITNK